MRRAQVLLADDHRMVAEGLRLVLGEEYDVAGIVEDGRAMLEAARRLQPDLIVADISMPHLNGIDALVQLKHDIPAARVIFLTMHRELAYARSALRAGAAGFVLKHSAGEELLSAVHAVLHGRTYITPALAGEILTDLRQNGDGSSSLDRPLTPRQREILQLLVEGQSAKEIARSLSISARTVEFHKYEMMESLGIRNTAELIHFGIKHDIVA